jgi:hypothetical protein
MKAAAKPKADRGRCCWICGKPGGSGATFALRAAGYFVPFQQIGYAHAPCVIKARKRLAEQTKARPS